MISLNVYPQCELPVVDISPGQRRANFTGAGERVAPPGSSSAVEEVADAELSEKLTVLRSSLVAHQDVWVNLQHNLKSGNLSSSTSTTSSAEPEVKNCVLSARQNLSGLIRQK